MHDPSGFSPQNLGQHDKPPVKRNTCRDSRERPWPPWELPWIQRYTARRPGCEAKCWASSHLHGPSLQQLPDQKSDKQKNRAFHQNSYQYQHHILVLFAKVILNHSPWFTVFVCLWGCTPVFGNSFCIVYIICSIPVSSLHGSLFSGLFAGHLQVQRSRLQFYIILLQIARMRFEFPRWKMLQVVHDLVFPGSMVKC